MIIQKLHKKNENTLKTAGVYYRILSSVNSLGLAKREIELIAFAAVHGNISRNSVKEEFCRQYPPTSIATIGNMVSKLRKMNIFIKESKIIRVNPVIALDFSKPITLQITLSNGETD